MKKNLLFLVVAVISIIAFTSCSKTGNNEPDKESQTTKTSTIVGKWKYSFSSGFCMLTFKADGSGVYYEYDGGHIDAEDEPFYYKYDEDKCVLQIFWIEDGSVVEEDMCMLTWINNNTFVADDLLDPKSTWTRQ